MLNQYFDFSIAQSSIHMASFVSVIYCSIALGGIVGDVLIGHWYTLIAGLLLACIGYFFIFGHRNRSS